MAIDLGSENIKISIVKPGKIPISIVINEMSKRKTSASLAVVEGSRLVGEEAAALSARYRYCFWVSSLGYRFITSGIIGGCLSLLLQRDSLGALRM